MARVYELHGLHSPQQPIDNATSVTPNDSADLADAPTRGLWIGSAGNVKVDMYGTYDKDGNAITGSTVTFVGCTAGSVLPIRVKRVHSTSTTASSILALY